MKIEYRKMYWLSDKIYTVSVFYCGIMAVLCIIGLGFTYTTLPLKSAIVWWTTGMIVYATFFALAFYWREAILKERKEHEAELEEKKEE